MRLVPFLLAALTAAKLSLPATAQIDIYRATYGPNCGAPVGNETAHLSEACQGKQKCTYILEPEVVGDPAHGCVKKYEATFTCGHGGAAKNLSIDTGTGHTPITIDCSRGVTAQPQTPGAGKLVHTSPFESADRIGQRVEKLDTSTSRTYMRLCIIRMGCQSLIWHDDHYAGIDDSGVLQAEFKVVKWDGGSIVLTGKTVRPDSSGNIATGVFTAKISPDGKRADGEDAWEAGSYKGVLPIKMAWGNDPAIASPGMGQHAAAEVTPSLKPPVFKVPIPKGTTGEGMASKGYYTLGGIWDFESVSGTANYQGDQITIYQFKDQIVATKIKGAGPQIPGQDWFGAGFNSLHTLEGHIHTWDAMNPEAMVWRPVTITADDADHLTVGNGIKFRRLTRSAIPKEVPCDVNNPMHISAEDAWGRHWYYDSRNDVADATCWIYVAAIQGNLKAEGEYALMLFKGTVIHQDLPQAYAWAQQAAIGGNRAAEGLLSDIFNDGTLVQKDHDRWKYWAQRFDAKDENRRYDLYLKAPAWMFKTSSPCNPANPNHENAGDAFWKGQVAYEAALHSTANCWLTISANQGFAMAYETLSKQYLAGEAVPKDPVMAFNYMKKAAEMGDPYGEGYLAEFYRTGTGNPGDMHQAIYWRDKLTATSQGQNVWDDIRDIKEKSRAFWSRVGTAAAEASDKVKACIETEMKQNPLQNKNSVNVSCETQFGPD